MGSPLPPSPGVDHFICRDTCRKPKGRAKGREKKENRRNSMETILFTLTYLYYTSFRILLKMIVTFQRVTWLKNAAPAAKIGLLNFSLSSSWERGGMLSAIRLPPTGMYCRLSPMRLAPEFFTAFRMTSRAKSQSRNADYKTSSPKAIPHPLNLLSRVDGIRLLCPPLTEPYVRFSRIRLLE